MHDPQATGETEVPRDVQADIRRQIDDIVERFGGRRPRRAPAFEPVPLPPGETGDRASRRA